MISKESMEDYELTHEIIDKLNKKIANSESTNDEWINDIEIVRIID